MLRAQDSNLRHTLQFGIGMHHAGLGERDRKLVERLFVEQKIQVPSDCHWAYCIRRASLEEACKIRKPGTCCVMMYPKSQVARLQPASKV